MDEHTISPAGDPFYAASRRTDDTIEAHYASLERGIPCYCYGGVVYVGYLVEGDDGEEVEAFEAVPCRRCVGGVPALLVEVRVNQKRGGDK